MNPATAVPLPLVADRPQLVVHGLQAAQAAAELDEPPLEERIFEVDQVPCVVRIGE